ncbi:necrosis inducing protein [Colletotrichum navitas]|uniref:Necrosis inducing protein n=1 Tax=Colletotrichum navitas TaxID=681940 RepID=A0AAD8PL09_9PEZI|nr:necrosis inducing protein [Colletotrichum navitas]KAK1569711.1 necrosis inducing protein [Colletotrichum navitas]
MLVGKLIPFLGMLRAASCTPVDRFLDRRATVGHDTLKPLPQQVQDNWNGQAIARFNPLLHIASGCQPYTAVDASGNIRYGFKYNNRWAIMYAWYWPKDQTLDGLAIGAHRHDWEHIVVFLNDPSDPNPKILGGGASGHGEYKTTDFPPREGDSVKAEYYADFPTNHELQFTAKVGRTYPVLDWDAMSTTMQNALSNADFGDADVPFIGGSFLSNLGKAAAF